MENKVTKTLHFIFLSSTLFFLFFAGSAMGEHLEWPVGLLALSSLAAGLFSTSNGLNSKMFSGSRIIPFALCIIFFPFSEIGKISLFAFIVGGVFGIFVYWLTD